MRVRSLYNVLGMFDFIGSYLFFFVSV